MAEKSHRTTEKVPTRQAVAVHPARTNGDIGILGRTDHGGDVRRGMGKVAIKRDEGFVFLRVGPRDRLGVSCADAEFSGSMMNDEAGDFFFQFLE